MRFHFKFSSSKNNLDTPRHDPSIMDNNIQGVRKALVDDGFANIKQKCVPTRKFFGFKRWYTLYEHPVYLNKCLIYVNLIIHYVLFISLLHYKQSAISILQYYNLLRKIRCSLINSKLLINRTQIL